jgi:hypothetical protein
MQFVCNVCGNATENPEPFHREGGTCRQCGANQRFRALMHVLSTELFHTRRAIPDFPVSPEICGMGLSDAPHYADRLAGKFSYTNYYYHTTPFLDIRQPPPELYGRHDFLIASDVFEHVPPPRLTPFRQAWELLKPGGLLVFSVPYTELPGTLESYPELHDYEIVEGPSGYVLINRTPDGRIQVYRDLFWHGGPGDTLELRVYCQAHLEFLLQASGFADIRFFTDDAPEIGIFQKDQVHSYVLSARRPLTDTALAAPDGAEESRFVFPANALPTPHPMLHPPRLEAELPFK